jgi:hypothetical protein
MSPRSRRRGAADIAMLARCPKCLDLHFALQKSVGPNVRFGSKADIASRLRNVRFVPKADILHCGRDRCYSKLIGGGKYCLGMVMPIRSDASCPAIGKTLLRSKRIPDGTVGELQVAEIGSKSHTDA